MPDQQDPTQYPSPSGEEIMTGSLAEMIEELGENLLGPASLPPGLNTLSEAIPDWFLKLSEDI